MSRVGYCNVCDGYHSSLVLCKTIRKSNKDFMYCDNCEDFHSPKKYCNLKRTSTPPKLVFTIEEDSDGEDHRVQKIESDILRSKWSEDKELQEAMLKSIEDSELQEAIAKSLQRTVKPLKDLTEDVVYKTKVSLLGKPSRDNIVFMNSEIIRKIERAAMGNYKKIPSDFPLSKLLSFWIQIAPRHARNYLTNDWSLSDIFHLLQDTSVGEALFEFLAYIIISAMPVVYQLIECKEFNDLPVWCRKKLEVLYTRDMIDFCKH